ncbi:MAG: ribokinase [Chloroflexota bacterium]|nr:MAG: ribokinase [Chloroflexota bacterium]
MRPSILKIMPILQPVQDGVAPEFLTIGHVTRDIFPDGSFSLGGTATFAAITARRLGLASAVVTCADAQLLPASTTFSNQYHEGFRTQYLLARADSLLREDVPAAWRNSPVVLLGPLAQELDSAFVTLFPRRPGALIAATPQGWLRRWDDAGRVSPTPWTAAEQVLPLLDVLILSHDDLLPFAEGSRDEADAILTRWSAQVPLLVATDGRHGATLFQYGRTERFEAYPVEEVDPTGAGDVFAAAFLCHLYQNGDPGAAVNFANCVASFSIEKAGVEGIPTREMVNERLL